MPHEDRNHKIMEEFHRNYKPDSPIHSKIELAQSTLNRWNQEVFTDLHTDFEARKLACDAFEHKGKKFLEELEQVKTARIADMQELTMLRKDSKETKEQLGHYKKKYEDMEVAYKALEESSKKKEDELRKKSWKRGTAITNLKEEVRNLKEDKIRLSQECASLGSAHEGSSDTINELKTRLVSLQSLVDGTDKVIDNIYY